MRPAFAASRWGRGGGQLDAQQLVPHHDARPMLQGHRATCRDGDAIAAVVVDQDEIGILRAHRRVLRAHRWIVRENPVPALAADVHVAARRQLNDVARAAIGAELRKTGDVGARRHAPHALGRVGFRGVRSGVTEPLEAQHLRADQDQLTIGQAVGSFEKDPRAVAAAEVAYLESPFLPRQFGVQRGKKLIFQEADITFGAPDRRRGVLALEARHFGGHLGNQNQYEGVIGASVGNEAAVESSRSVRAGRRSAQRAGSIRCGTAARAWPPPARARNQSPPAPGPAPARRPPRAPPPGPRPPPLVREPSPPPPPPPPPPSAPPPPLPAATAARAAAALVSGLPQSEQNCAPASFCRPQYWQALRAIKLGGPIYCSTLPCATCDSCVSGCLSPRRAARLLPQPVVSLPPQRQSPVRASHSTSPSSIPTLPSRSRRRIRHSCSEVSAAGVAMSVRATPGARVRLRMEGKQGEVWFVPDTLPEEPAWGVRVFGTDTSAYRLPPAADRYVAWLPATPLCDAMVEAIVGTDTARAVWPLVLDTLAHAHPIVVVLNDDTAHTGKSDSLTVGKAVPYGTYNWFFPLGTTSVATARWGSQTRLQLSRGTIAWVNTADVVPLAPGTPPPGGIVGSVRLTAGPRSLVLRVPLPTHVPYKVEEDEKTLTLRLYGVASDVNWMQYGGAGPLVDPTSYPPPASAGNTITVSLAGPVWGYRTRWSGRDLLLEIRRPPVIDPRRPLAGRTIVLDPGHPPLGAKGPAGLWEPVATLAVAEQAEALLERAGATAVLTTTEQ